MHCHGPTCLRGPVTRRREWWSCFIDMENPRHMVVAHPEDAPPSRSDPDIRWDLVDRVRQEIADGTYETPEKVDTALDRLLQRLGG